MSAAISALTGGRPVRYGWVHFRVTRRRCQRRTAPGDQPVHPQPWWQEPDQRGEDRAVGLVQPGRGLARHSPACAVPKLVHSR